MLRNADVFVKPRHDLRSKSALGGVVTLIAGTTAAVLFVAQIYLYIVGATQHSLHLSESKSIPLLPGQPDPLTDLAYIVKGKIPLRLHITFPHLTCDMLEVKLNNANPSNADFDPARGRGLELRRPNPVELKKAIGDQHHQGGCTIRTVLRIPIVAGQVTITMTRQAWMAATNMLMMRSQQTEEERASDKNVDRFNVSHYVHSVQFGKPFPLASHFPLEDRNHIIKNQMGGMALENVQVRLIPTVYKRLFSSQNTYQLSVVDHTVQPETLVANGVPMFPGLSLSYDFTPLAVHHIEGRDNFFVFLSSLISIVGGVFVTVGLFTGCVLHSAAAVAKKTD
jgi:hypothetical protein